jgi:altronate dehydratase large subunit
MSKVMESSIANAMWRGYLRQDGRKGIRNLILVIYTVECASFVAHQVALGEQDVHVIGFPGCYDNAYAIRLMLALATHPNVGACLAIGLGCEYTQPAKLADVASNAGRPSDWFYIQESGGTRTGVERGKAALQALRTRRDAATVEVEMGWKDLVLGAECGGSDGTSGLAANPVVGRLYDLVIECGGSAVFEEVVEMIGLRDVLLSRAVSHEVAVELDSTYKKAEEYCKAVRQYSVSPGNFAGGLTTIEEKSMGAFAKSGSHPIRGVIRVAQKVPSPGLWLLDSVPDSHFMQFGYTNPNDTEGIMDLISVGAQIVLFVTGRGSVIGSPVAPLIKVTGNSRTFARMNEDMDFNAGAILEGKMTLDEAALDLMDMVRRVAAGEPSKPEALGHREYFVMYKHQETPDLSTGCRA